jgi:hypothetical protein
MNVLSRDQQILIIGCLTDGMSIRATERMHDLSENGFPLFGIAFRITLRDCECCARAAADQ